MTWVCPNCATNNDGSCEACIVCDTAKPIPECRLTLSEVGRLGLTGDITIPEMYNIIDEGAFAGRSDITSVTLHAGVTAIAARAFEGCCALLAVRGGTLASIGALAFHNCAALAAARPTATAVAPDAFLIDPPPSPPSEEPRTEVLTDSPAESREKKQIKWGDIAGAVIVALPSFFAIFSLVYAIVDFANGNIGGHLWLCVALLIPLLGIAAAVYDDTDFFASLLIAIGAGVLLLNALLLACIGSGYLVVAVCISGLAMVSFGIATGMTIYDLCEYGDAEGIDLLPTILGTAIAIYAFVAYLLVLLV